MIQKVTTASLNTLILKGTTRTIKSNSCLARGQLIHRDTLRGSAGLPGRTTGFHLQLQVPVWNWCTVKALAVLISKDRSCSMYLVRLSAWDTFPKVSLGEKVGKISDKTSEFLRSVSQRKAYCPWGPRGCHGSFQTQCWAVRMQNKFACAAAACRSVSRRGQIITAGVKWEISILTCTSNVLRVMSSSFALVLVSFSPAVGHI